MAPGSCARRPNPLVFALSPDLWHETIAIRTNSTAMCPGSQSHRYSHSTGFRFIHRQPNQKTYADCLQPRSAARSLDAIVTFESLRARAIIQVVPISMGTSLRRLKINPPVRRRMVRCPFLWVSSYLKRNLGTGSQGVRVTRNKVLSVLRTKQNFQPTGRSRT